MEYLHRSVQSLWWRWLLTRCGIFDGSGNHRLVSGCDRQRDYEKLPGGICADSNWPFANAVSLDRNSDLQCFTESCPIDCDSVVWRFRSTRLSLVILGSPDLWRRCGRHYRSLASSGVASSHVRRLCRWHNRRRGQPLATKRLTAAHPHRKRGGGAEFGSTPAAQDVNVTLRQLRYFDALVQSL